MNSKYQNLLSVVLIAVALVVGSASWLPLGATVEKGPQQSAESAGTQRAG